MNNKDSINTFLEVEHEIVDFNTEQVSFGLFVITFSNTRDKGIVKLHLNKLKYFLFIFFYSYQNTC